MRAVSAHSPPSCPHVPHPTFLIARWLWQRGVADEWALKGFLPQDTLWGLLGTHTSSIPSPILWVLPSEVSVCFGCSTSFLIGVMQSQKILLRQLRGVCRRRRVVAPLLHWWWTPSGRGLHLCRCTSTTEEKNHNARIYASRQAF